VAPTWLKPDCWFTRLTLQTQRRRGWLWPDRTNEPFVITLSRHTRNCYCLSNAMHSVEHNITSFYVGVPIRPSSKYNWKVTAITWQLELFASSSQSPGGDETGWRRVGMYDGALPVSVMVRWTSMRRLYWMWASIGNQCSSTAAAVTWSREQVSRQRWWRAVVVQWLCTAVQRAEHCRSRAVTARMRRRGWRWRQGLYSVTIIPSLKSAGTLPDVHCPDTQEQCV